MDSFNQWSIGIAKNTIIVYNQYNEVVASKNANTSTLKPSYYYTIYITNGRCYIWVESHVNMPSFIELDIIDQSLMLMNTPKPNCTYGRPTPGHSGRRVEPHRCVFV